MMDKDFLKALDTIKDGGVILYPTETIWGIGCDATNGEAVRRIFEIKRRADGKAMISLVDSVEMLEKWVENVPDVARELIAESKGPVSIIFDRPNGIAEELKADDGSAAFRICNLKFAASLARELGRPLVSTSANVSGQTTACSFNEISSEIKDSVDYIVKFGRDIQGCSPSSIVKITDDGTVVKLR